MGFEPVNSHHESVNAPPLSLALCDSTSTFVSASLSYPKIVRQPPFCFFDFLIFSRSSFVVSFYLVISQIHRVHVLGTLALSWLTLRNEHDGVKSSARARRLACTITNASSQPATRDYYGTHKVIRFVICFLLRLTLTRARSANDAWGNSALIVPDRTSSVPP
jgi:hypothetical protein